jgi:hypothetical protein
VEDRLRPLRLAIAALALAAAVLAALLAVDVRAWHDGLRDGDARLAAGERGRWEADERFGGLARRFLEIDDDLAARRALALFRVARQRGQDLGGGLERQGARGAAETALADVAQNADPGTAAQASVLLGVLAFSDPRTGGPEVATPVERALAAFEQAHRLDPGNEAAKYDLELILRLLEARGGRPGAAPGAGPRAGGRRGAGGGTPGRGY